MLTIDVWNSKIEEYELVSIEILPGVNGIVKMHMSRDEYTLSKMDILAIAEMIKADATVQSYRNNLR